MPLEQLVRDLMRLGVGVEVRGGDASFTLPEKEPQRSSAESAVRRSLPLVRDHRDDFVRVWSEIAGGEMDPVRCAECRGWVFWTPRGTLAWAYCEYLWCPGRTDERAAEFQQRHYPPHVRRTWRARMLDQFRIKRRATGEDTGPEMPPITD
jgi:hypothetical protein